MTKITAVLVDDVSTALDNLKRMLSDYIPEVEILGQANSVVTGAKMVKTHKPEIVFLDIEMPDGTGFDVIDLLPDDLNVRVIFTTGSEAYALKAFRYAAVDYLLKPIDPDDLKAAVSKAMSTQARSTVSLKDIFQQNQDNSGPKRIALHTADEVMVVEIKDIIRCQSMDNYCHVFLSSGEKVLMSKPLKYFSDMLESSNFIRVHQSHLVNFSFIHSFVKKEGGYLLLKDETQVPVSIRKRTELLTKLSV